MPSTESSRNGRPHARPADAVKRFFRESALPDVGAAFERACAAGAAPGTLAGLAAGLLAEPEAAAVLGERRQAKALRLLREHAGEEGTAGRLSSVLPALAAEAEALAREWGLSRVNLPCLLAACLSPRLDDPAAARLRARLAPVLEPRHLRPRAGADGLTCAALGFGRDLTALARAGHWPVCPAEGAERELRLLVTYLLAGRPVVAVGLPGVGKTTLAFALAWHLARATRPLIPPALDGASVVAVTREDLLAGTGDRGALEKRLGRFFDTLRRRPDLVAFFDELHAAFDATDAAGQLIASALKGALALGGFRFVGATTERDYARHVLADEALHLAPGPRRPARADARPGGAAALAHPAQPPAGRARAAGVGAGEDAVRAAVRLTDAHQPTERRPRKAALLLADAAADRLYDLTRDGAPAGAPRLLTAADVARTFSDRSGLPLAELDADPRARFRALAARLNERVAGQQAAVDAVVALLQTRALGWGSGRRPLGTFLFLGPPGVGKSLLAGELARCWLHDGHALFAQNLGGFRGEAALNRLRGAPPGYVGFGASHTAFDHLAVRPRAVVAFDEADKADGVLADALLEILDGRPRDASGRTVSVSQSVVILTANAPPGLVSPDTGEAEVRDLLPGLGDVWRPALLDRLDRVLVFRPLGEEALLRVLDRLIDERAGGRAVPAHLASEEARRAIVRRALAGEEHASARRLETELDRRADRPGNDHP